MPRPRDERRRVNGPHWIKSIERWRITCIDPEQDQPKDRRRDLCFRERDEAEEAKRQIEAKYALLDGTTIESALIAYKQYLSDKGNRDVSCDETTRRIGLFFPDHKQKLARLTEEQAKFYYAAFARRTYQVGPKDNPRTKPVSVDFQRNGLSQVKTFLRWCVAQGWIRLSPAEHVKGVGKRRKGKPQHTGDEATKFLAAALDLAAKDDGALGAAMLLLLGTRQGELVRRQVRDVDLGGTRLLISEAKTKAGNGFVEIPEVLQPLVLKRTEGRAAEALLFPAKRGQHTKSWLRSAVRRICVKAGVPVVPPHGLRGTFSSVAHRAGVASHVVAAQLGHKSTATTLGSYTDAGAVRAAQQGALLKVVQGGKR